SASTGRTHQWHSPGAYWDPFVSSQSAFPPRWSGANNGGYVNPAVDNLYERWLKALDPNEKLNFEADFNKLIIDELAILPLVYDFEIFAYRKNLEGPKVFTFE